MLQTFVVICGWHRGESLISPFPRYEHSDSSSIVVADRQLDTWKCYTIMHMLVRNQREYSTLASVNGAAALCIVLTCKTPRIQPNFRYSIIYEPFFNLPGRSKISNLRYCLLSLTSTQGFVGDRPSFFNLMNTEFNESAYLLMRSSWRSTNNCV
jgi:hypothetical protein